MQISPHYSFNSPEFHHVTMLNTPLLSTASTEANSRQRKEGKFLTKFPQARTVQDAYLTTCTFKIIFQGQAEAPNGLDQGVHSPPDHEYHSCRADVPAFHTPAQGSSSINTSEVLPVAMGVSPPHPCLSLEPVKPRHAL